LKIKEVEKKLKIKIKKNINVLGIDTASRTGWATIKTNSKNLEIDYGYIDVRKLKSLNEKYDAMINSFGSLIKPKQNKVVIEDTFFGPNVYTLKLLSRIGMIVYVLARLKKIKNVFFINASSARSRLNFNSRAKKEEIHKEFRRRIKIKILDKDIMDAIILALNGVLI